MAKTRIEIVTRNTKLMAKTWKKTPATMRKLEEAYSYGCTDDEAAHYAGITRATLQNWTREDAKLSARFQALKTKPIFSARRSLHDHIPKDGNLALKYLERAKPEEFAPEAHLRIEGGNFSTVLVDYDDYLKARELKEKQAEAIDGEVTETES